MIAQDVLLRSESIRRSFQDAKPFKHACIDGFFETEPAESLLRDFPRFDTAKAINEVGEVGQKSVHTNLPEISAFYAQVHHYLMSQAFLDAMTAITGIEALIPDPGMYGGGTHENRHGQELDPHIDFNQLTVNGTTVHRRANLLLYLNKEWNDAWGGAIELHSNPREPDTNRILAFTPLFNRAVIFETNEISWHGFPLIQLPQDRRSVDSRKCLSVYLYTRDRPAHERAGTHGTFYVQRPLPARFAAGYTLTEDDVATLRQAVGGRDQYIAFYQRREEQAGREISNLQAHVAELLAGLRLPVSGFARQIGKVTGAAYADGWCGRRLRIELEAARDLCNLAIKGDIPELAGSGPIRFAVQVGTDSLDFCLEQRGGFALEIPVRQQAGTRFSIEIACDRSFSPAALALNADQRDLSYLLIEIACT